MLQQCCVVQTKLFLWESQTMRDSSDKNYLCYKSFATIGIWMLLKTCKFEACCICSVVFFYIVVWHNFHTSHSSVVIFGLPVFRYTLLMIAYPSEKWLIQWETVARIYCLITTTSCIALRILPYKVLTFDVQLLILTHQTIGSVCKDCF